MAHDVFISYSSQDKAVADAVTATLERRKIRCWIAPRDVLPGVPYGEALIDGIENSRVMVLVFSSNSNTSPQVMREVERAVSKGIPIIPFRIEDVAPSRSLEYYISAPHWLDAWTPPLQQHIDRLADTIQRLLKIKEEEVPISAPPPPTLEPSRMEVRPERLPWTKMAIGIVIGSVVLLLLALGVGSAVERIRMARATRVTATVAPLAAVTPSPAATPTLPPANTPTTVPVGVAGPTSSPTSAQVVSLPVAATATKEQPTHTVPPPTPTVQVQATSTPSPQPVQSPTDTPTIRPTDTPIPTSTSTTAPGMVAEAVVNNPSLNMREGPGDFYAVVKNYPQGTSLLVLGRMEGGEWLKVQASDGQTGWMYAPYLKVNADLATVPLVGTPTPPARPVGRIAYTVYKANYEYDIYIINADGSNKRLLVADASEPAFTKDGRRILFYSWKGNGVDIMNLDSSNRQRVINDGEASFAHLATDGWTVVYQTGQVDWVKWKFDMFIKACNLDGSNIRTICQGEQPSVNPRTNQIVAKTCDGGNCGLFRMNLDGSSRKKITQYADDQNPAWSPDGSRIAFASIRDGNWEIYVMNADGSGQRRLTNNPTTDALPAWLPDGRYIAFRSDRGGVWAIYVMLDDGSDVYKVTNAPCSSQRWRWEKMTTIR